MIVRSGYGSYGDASDSGIFAAPKTILIAGGAVLALGIGAAVFLRKSPAPVQGYRRRRRRRR